MFKDAILFRMVALVSESDFRIAKFAILDHVMALKSFLKIKFSRLGLEILQKSLFRIFKGAILFRMVALVGESDFRIAKFAFLDHVMELKKF